MHTLEVYDPTGTMEITQLYAPRFPDLKGKTICELSNSAWEDERTFPRIRELLKGRFPDIKIIPYTEFSDISDSVNDAVLSRAIEKKGCDGIIVGNAA
ncbi:hypothetical protein ACFLXK_03765 [Chloroflexota bacterium]